MECKIKPARHSKGKAIRTRTRNQCPSSQLFLNASIPESSSTFSAVKETPSKQNSKGQRVGIPFQIAVHNREENLEEEIDRIYQYGEQVQPCFARHLSDCFPACSKPSTRRMCVSVWIRGFDATAERWWKVVGTGEARSLGAPRGKVEVGGDLR